MTTTASINAGVRARLDARVSSARAALRASTVGRAGWAGKAWRVLAWIAYRAAADKERGR